MKIGGGGGSCARKDRRKNKKQFLIRIILKNNKINWKVVAGVIIWRVKYHYSIWKHTKHAQVYWSPWGLHISKAKIRVRRL